MAGAAALPGLEASNKALRDDMRDATKSRLEGLKVHLDAQVHAGLISQKDADAKLQSETMRIGYASQAASSARSDATKLEGQRITEAGQDRRATTAANMQRLQAATADAEQLERESVAIRKALGEFGPAPKQPEGGFFFGASDRAKLAFEDQRKTYTNLIEQERANRAAREAARRRLAHLASPAIPPGAGGAGGAGSPTLTYDPTTQTLVR